MASSTRQLHSENDPFSLHFFIMRKANIKPQNNRHKGREPWGCESKEARE